MRWNDVAKFTPFIWPRFLATTFSTSRLLFLPAATSSLLIRWLCRSLRSSGQGLMRRRHSHCMVGGKRQRTSEPGRLVPNDRSALPARTVAGRLAGASAWGSQRPGFLAVSPGPAIPTTPRLRGELVLLHLLRDSLRHSTSDAYGLELLPSWFAVLTELYLSSCSKNDFIGQERQGMVISTSVMMAGHERDRVMGPSARSSPAPSQQCTKVFFVKTWSCEAKAATAAIR